MNDVDDGIMQVEGNGDLKMSAIDLWEAPFQKILDSYCIVSKSLR